MLATRFPYTQEVIVATARTDPDGSYRFDEVFTPYNTRYRVLVSDGEVEASSGELTVYAYPIVDLTLDVVRKRALGTITLTFSPAWQYSLDGLETVFYFHKVGTKAWRAIDKSTVELVAPGEVFVKGEWRLPRSRKSYRFTYGWCIAIPGEGLQDIGLGEPAPTGCPRRYRTRRDASAGRASAAAALGLAP